MTFYLLFLFAAGGSTETVPKLSKLCCLRNAPHGLFTLRCAPFFNSEGESCRTIVFTLLMFLSSLPTSTLFLFLILDCLILGQVWFWFLYVFVCGHLCPHWWLQSVTPLLWFDHLVVSIGRQMIGIYSLLGGSWWEFACILCFSLSLALVWSVCLENSDISWEPCYCCLPCHRKDVLMGLAHPLRSLQLQ